MRKAKIVAAIILVILIGAWFLFQSPDQYGPNQPLVKAPVEMVSEHESKQKSEVIDTKRPSLASEELLKAHPEMKTLDTVQKLMNSKMVFYGRTIDQDGSPVAGAKIEYNIAKYKGLTLPGMGWTIKHAVEQSDENGQFIIDEPAALHLNINAINRAGYVFAGGGRKTGIRTTPRHEGGEFYQPDPANPVIFHAWKKTETARELRRGEQRKIYRADGQFRELPIPELKDAFQIAFENLDTTVSEDASDRSKWRVHLKANGGGLIETHDAFTFEAPEAGYLQDWEAVSEENRDIEKTFYIKTPDGNYGRLNVKLIGYYGNDPVSKQRGYIRYQYTLNPTGSRNLLSEKD